MRSLSDSLSHSLSLVLSLSPGHVVHIIHHEHKLARSVFAASRERESRGNDSCRRAPAGLGCWSRNACGMSVYVCVCVCVYAYWAAGLGMHAVCQCVCVCVCVYVYVYIVCVCVMRTKHRSTKHRSTGLSRSHSARFLTVQLASVLARWLLNVSNVSIARKFRV